MSNQEQQRVVEYLNDLPGESVVINRYNLAYQKRHGLWFIAGVAQPVFADRLAEEGPLRIVIAAREVEA